MHIDWRRLVLIPFVFILLSIQRAEAQSAQAIRTLYSDTNVGQSDWVVLVPTLPHAVSSLVIPDTSGQVMEIGICAAGASPNSEVRQVLIPAGGVSLSIVIPSTQRISIRAVSAPAVSGENDLTVVF